VCRGSTELEGPKGLRAEIGKYSNSTNERKTMSKKTLRKRISLTVVSALIAGILSTVATPAANAAVGDANVLASAGVVNGSLMVATIDSTAIGATAHNGTAVGAANTADVRSKGILVKDSTSGTAQTATMLAGGILSLYAQVTTTAAMSASAGSFSGAVAGTTGSLQYGSSNATVLFTGATAATGATAIAALWTAPTTAGTYSVSLYVGNGAGTVPTLASPAVTLAGRVTVTVVAASAGGSYSAAYSLCNTSTIAAAATGVDSTSTVNNGGLWIINFDLDDAYDVSLGSGNLVATATNSAIVAFGTNTATGTGTTSTVVEYGSSQNRSISVAQPTANAPVTTTVTLSFNGTTVCTKTVTIKGEVASLEIQDLLTGDLSSANASVNWGDRDGTGRLGALGYFVAKDSAGNIVDQDALGTVAVDSATITPLVTAATLVLGSTDSTSGAYLGTIAWTCGAVASTANLKIKFTNTTSGTVITSPAFEARCADNPYTYTVSWDKASYNQGELAKLTVQFKDRKGNNANSLPAGASVITAPMFTVVSTTGSATAYTKADGTVQYTFAVGLSTGITEGTYTSTVDFTSLTAVAATVATSTYKVGTGVTVVTNADVLKSIVALIASINKQIQALQKLILKR